MIEELKLQDPLSPFRIGQRFGQNLVDFYVKAGNEGHEGLDFGYAFADQRLYFVHDAWVYKLFSGTRTGIGVQIITGKQYHHAESFYNEVQKKNESYDLNAYWVFNYGHLKCWNPALFDGGFFPAGTFLGIGDNTGAYTTGPHLHFDATPKKLIQQTMSSAVTLQTQYDYFAKSFFEGQFIDEVANKFYNRVPIEDAFYWDEIEDMQRKIAYLLAQIGLLKQRKTYTQPAV